MFNVGVYHNLMTELANNPRNDEARQYLINYLEEFNKFPYVLAANRFIWENKIYPVIVNNYWYRTFRLKYTVWRIYNTPYRSNGYCWPCNIYEECKKVTSLLNNRWTDLWVQWVYSAHMYEDIGLVLSNKSPKRLRPAEPYTNDNCQICRGEPGIINKIDGVKVCHQCTTKVR
jgi:hypothetical protein